MPKDSLGLINFAPKVSLGLIILCQKIPWDSQANVTEVDDDGPRTEIWIETSVIYHLIQFLIEVLSNLGIPQTSAFPRFHCHRFLDPDPYRRHHDQWVLQNLSKICKDCNFFILSKRKKTSEL